MASHASFFFFLNQQFITWIELENKINNFLKNKKEKKK